jgi:serine protease inhibitor
MYYVNSDYDLRVNLWLPKFEINTRINLVKMLKNMGFNPSNYFTEMADTNMILNESYQKATIDVNEKYTEAAAMSVAITAVGAYYKP